ncbi:MotE family protein [Desertibacillus haloalkaliphilus]|uniref:MotE family protein n=1 Tax=Desertibacillus haloalkaliphilus TaxID=1328930 RepID=UPI001C27F520|nr:MotE family protein [Desertibacillus haloalkaliphilus]MBU8907010.1 MotE family protein [Desertibacillus haloalkaliphilus]
MATKEKEYSKFQWFFLIIFIPTIFAVLLLGVILSFLGFNVIDEAKELGSNVPVLSSYLSDEEDDEEEKVDVDGLITSLENKQAELERLERQLDQKDEEIASLQDEIVELELAFAQEQQQTADHHQEMADLASTYESMSAKNAARILSELSNEEVLFQISELNTETRAKILSNMGAERAAEIMRLLAN